MRKLIISMHVSLDGYAAGPKGEMDWIRFDDAMFEFVGGLTDQSDTALYGRITYDMMEAYWPTAGDKPKATAHDKHHSAWYNSVNKVVVSESLQHNLSKKLEVISGDLKGNIEKLKSQPGKNIVIFGSPSIVRQLIEYDLIDEYWLMMNPVILGSGISTFPKDIRQMNLEPGEIRSFACGATGMNYKKK